MNVTATLTDADGRHGAALWTPYCTAPQERHANDQSSSSRQAAQSNVLRLPRQSWQLTLVPAMWYVEPVPKDGRCVVICLRRDHLELSAHYHQPIGSQEGCCSLDAFPTLPDIGKWDQLRVNSRPQPACF
eukprot:GHUV01051993.1.p1 GENE.GHUV01051993.1~~GHUV01051993.1.p1  ORF type:complete len:130 (-),score=3.19 GHUV01051993.1:301-690(-)